jgi:phosphoglycerate dehydrogenase-like enzyme
MNRVLISSGPIRNQPGSFREILRDAGFEPVDPPGDHTLTEAELGSYLPKVVAMIAGGEAITAELMSRASGLRVIARTGVGYDAVDLDAARRHGIVVTFTPGLNHAAVAEQAFALLLAVVKRVVSNDRTIRAGGWDRTLVEPIRDRVLGLVGMGRIGRAMAPIARAFQMNVLAYDPLSRDDRFNAEHGVQQVELEDVLSGADFLSLHLPLTAETRHFLDRAKIGRMKRGAILINTARGGVVDESALAEALESGQIAGAGLDVLSAEPPRPDHPLLGFPQVVFSPHIAGIDRRSMFDMAERAAWTITELAAGRWPAECVVNPEVRATWRW